MTRSSSHTLTPRHMIYGALLVLLSFNNTCIPSCVLALLSARLCRRERVFFFFFSFFFNLGTGCEVQNPLLCMCVRVWKPRSVFSRLWESVWTVTRYTLKSHSRCRTQRVTRSICIIHIFKVQPNLLNACGRTRLKRSYCSWTNTVCLSALPHAIQSDFKRDAVFEAVQHGIK